MPLDATRLATAMKTAMDSQLGAVTGADDTHRQGLCTALAGAVVAEIQGHATVTVASVSGVTAGSDSSGSGSGTVS